MRRIYALNFTKLAPQRRQFYNERIFQEQSSGTALENAKTALLQYNIMIDRGVKPDVLTFTSLIQTMAKARLEWQAYKLFSSMIDQGLEPLPETLVALKNATNPSRRRLIDDISNRIESVAENAPNALSKEMEALLTEGENAEKQRIDELFRSTSLPLQTASASSSPSHEDEDPFKESTLFDEESRRETVSIDHPIHSWNVYSNIGKGETKAQGNEATELNAALSKLHEEELRIFLSIHKLHRDGSHAEMADRLVRNVPSAVIKGMLSRRYKYFRSVESVTKTLLDNRRAIEEDDNQRLARGESIEELSTEYERHDSAKEAFESAGDLLYTPWGAIRKPLKALPSQAKNVITKAMPDEVLEEVLLRVSSGDTDQLPEQLLRQYAAHFALAWKRFHPDSLARAVQWHVENVLPSLLNERRAPATLAIKLRQQEVSGTTNTIESYEAMRVVAKHTKNLQVTDGAEEINTSIGRAAAVTSRAEERMEQQAKKDENLRSAAELKLRATQYSPSDDRLNFGQVLQEKHREMTARASQVMVGPSVPYIGKDFSNSEERRSVLAMPSKSAQRNEEFDSQLKTSTTSELPPWELNSASQPFNVDSGRFGDPTMGRYMELNDGRVQLMPQHEALDTHRSMTSLLPKSDREEILRHKVHAKALRERDEQVLMDKSEHHSYRRYHAFVNRAVEEERKASDAKPKQRFVEEPRRMGYHLRAGKDKKKIASDKFKKFMRPM